MFFTNELFVEPFKAKWTANLLMLDLSFSIVAMICFLMPHHFLLFSLKLTAVNPAFCRIVLISVMGTLCFESVPSSLTGISRTWLPYILFVVTSEMLVESLIRKQLFFAVLGPALMNDDELWDIKKGKQQGEVLNEYTRWTNKFNLMTSFWWSVDVGGGTNLTLCTPADVFSSVSYIVESEIL